MYQYCVVKLSKTIQKFDYLDQALDMVKKLTIERMVIDKVARKCKCKDRELDDIIGIKLEWK